MDYENRQAPEGINTDAEHPLRLFLRLALAAVALLLIIVLVLQFSGGWLAKRIPFRTEQAIIEKMGIDFGDEADSAEILDYLNSLASRLLTAMPRPEGLDVVVHYSSDETFNAFATIGGNLLFYRGLLERIPHENALAMVLAHEIAHVLHRDPVAGLGGGVASTVAIAVLAGNAGTGVAGEVIGRAGVFGGMEFTRRMEREADRAGLAAVADVYGHVAGAEALFQLVAEQRGESKVPSWLGRFTSTHPLDADRIRSIARHAEESGWSNEGAITPLPADFDAWLETGS